MPDFPDENLPDEVEDDLDTLEAALQSAEIPPDAEDSSEVSGLMEPPPMPPGYAEKLAARQAAMNRSREGNIRAAEVQTESQRDLQREEPTRRGRLTRTRRRLDNPFHVEKSVIPKGYSYEWKRVSCYGMKDSDHQIALRENHWQPVPATRHPTMAQPKAATIEKGGMILMERPLYLTEDAQKEDLAFARNQVDGLFSDRLRPTPPGTFTRDHPSARAASKLNRSFRSEIPDE